MLDIDAEKDDGLFNQRMGESLLEYAITLCKAGTSYESLQEPSDALSKYHSAQLVLTLCMSEAKLKLDSSICSSSEDR
jgi:hypothetical protein